MALNAGFTREIVMALGGWKSGRMMRRYAAVTDQILRAAAKQYLVMSPESLVGAVAIEGRTSLPHLREQLLDVDARVLRFEILRAEKTVVLRDSRRECRVAPERGPRG